MSLPIRPFVLALIVLTGSTVAGDPAVEGHWEGAVELPGQALEVQIDIERDGDGLKGTIDIPAQGARALPLRFLDPPAGKVQFQIVGVPGDPTFTGELSEDGATLSGTFAQGGAMLPFSLTSGESPVAAARRGLEGLDTVVTEALDDWKAAGVALSVVVDDTVVLSQGFGQRDVEAELPVTGDTLFAIGSATKAFTTFVLGQLGEQGKLDWDQPVAELLPGFRLKDDYATRHLSPRDMVSHRSGLPRHDMIWYADVDTTRAEFVERLRHLEPNKELRELFQYNNLMFMTAGHLARQLTGKSWEENVREGIFAPLGMTRSNFSVVDSQADDDHAIPYVNGEDDAIQRVEFRGLDAAGPAGSINSSVAEMAQWVRMHLGGGSVDGKTLASPATVQEMHTPQTVIPGLPDEPYVSPSSYGLGWFVDTWRGHFRVHHGGNIDGFSALVTLFPNDGVGIVVLANQGGSALPGLLTQVVADRVLGLEPREWIAEAARRRDAGKALTEAGEKNKELFRVKDTEPSRDLDDYVGEYEHPGYGTLAVRRNGKRLVVDYHTLEMPLEHWNYDVFNVIDLDEEDSSIIPEDIRVSFVGDVRGRVRTVTAPFEPFVDPIEFTRIPPARMRDPEFLGRLAGAYDLGPQRLRFRVEGDGLVGEAPGGQSFKLVVVDDLEFELEGIKGFSILFELGEDGIATRARVIQPNGVFDAERAED